MEGRHKLEDLDVDCRTVLKWLLKKHSLRVWNLLIWLKVEMSGRLL
jgi:hypothetical protein